MKILVDMNLSPAWCEVFKEHLWPSVHWSSVGDSGAADVEVTNWAEANGYALFTHDLDFGAILAATQAQGPSVIQVRTQDVLPETARDLFVSTLREHEGAIEAGALIVVDESHSRVRILPLAR